MEIEEKETRMDSICCWSHLFWLCPPHMQFAKPITLQSTAKDLELEVAMSQTCP